MHNTTYLDWAATSVPDPDIIAGMADIAASSLGNPSSIHRLGRDSASLLERTRKQCAALLGVKPSEIVFTSGGTEANNLIISSFMRKRSGYGVVTTGIEHPSVFESVHLLKEFGAGLRIVGGKANGCIEPEAIAESLDDKTDLVTVMLVSNDTGAVQQIEKICSLVREKERKNGRPIHLHCDMVQGLGKVPIDLGTLSVDSASFSAHKIKGPRGAGILYVKKPLQTVFSGGEQEYGMRPGTENLPAIWAMGEAMKKCVPKVNENARKAYGIKSILVDELQSMDFCRLLERADKASYSPFITAAFVPPVPGEVLVRVMSDKGYAISTGSACSRSAKKRIRPLAYLGISEADAHSAIRISIGYDTTEDDVRGFCKTLRGEAPKLLEISRK
jgi:cysteine desulfurase